MTRSTLPPNPQKVVHVTCVHVVTDTRILHRECASLVRAARPVVLIAPHVKDEILHGVPVRALKRRQGRLQRMTLGVWAAYRLAVKEGPAIFHLHDPELLPIAVLLRAKGWPVVYDAHEVLPHQVMDKFWIPTPVRPVAGFVGWLLERWAALVCSGLVAATPDIARRFGSRSAVLVQNFPDRREFGVAVTTPYSDRPMLVAYVGSIVETRGACEMVRAMSEVDPALGASLTLAGDIQPPELRSRLEGLPGWERCQATGRLDRAEVAALLARARVGLVLLHPTRSYPRNFPVKMFEYMAAGVPIVASDFPLWRELLASSDCALFVDPLDPAAIAAAVSKLLADPERAEAMARRGMDGVQRDFTWAAQEVRLLALYDRLAFGAAGAAN